MILYNHIHRNRYFNHFMSRLTIFKRRLPCASDDFYGLSIFMIFRVILTILLIVLWICTEYSDQTCFTPYIFYNFLIF